jgi:voltage-gated potassium channel
MDNVSSVIDPNDPKKIAWDLIVFLFVVLGVLLSPLALALQLPTIGWLLIIDSLINVVYLIDIIVQFRTGFYDRRQLVADRKRIAKRYIKNGFIFDLIATLPFSLIPGTTFSMANRFARIFRLTRMLKIFVIFRQLNRFSRAKLSSNSIRLSIMAFWLFITAHLITVGLLLVGGLPVDGPPAMRYLEAFYWTITTLATVGYGDITPDRSSPIQLIYTIFAQIVGVGMYGFVIGNIASVISRMDMAKSMFMERIEKVNTFMAYREVPDELQHRVIDYFYYLWDTRRGYDEATLVMELPRSIRVQLAQEIHRDVIRKVPLFRDATPAFIRDIVIHLEAAAFTPGDYIVHRGEPGDEMFFVQRGAVEVLESDGKTVRAVLSEGEFFGEIALIKSVERTATIRARDYCDLYSLHKNEFEMVLHKYPDFETRLNEIVVERYRT